MFELTQLVFALAAEDLTSFALLAREMFLLKASLRIDFKISSREIIAQQRSDRSNEV